MYCIEIEVGDDGAITVSAEPKEEAEQKEGARPAQGIDEALALAKQIFEAGGPEGAGQATEQPSAEDQFSAGYAQVRGGPQGAM